MASRNFHGRVTPAVRCWDMPAAQARLGEQAPAGGAGSLEAALVVTQHHTFSIWTKETLRYM